MEKSKTNEFVMQIKDSQNETPLPRLASIGEIAKLAGVGTATVDRALNGRKNVRKETRLRILQAKVALESGKCSVKRSKLWRFKVILPENAGPSTEFLAKCFNRPSRNGNYTVDCVFSKKMEPTILARKLRACAGQGVDAVAFQALDDPRVRDAVAYLETQGIPCLTVVSNLPGSKIFGFVGMDNRAAGRTAGLLMGRLARMAGKVTVVSGGQLYNVHEDREIGFRSLLRRYFSNLEIIETVWGGDNAQDNYANLLHLQEKYPDLVGVYSVGGGNDGIVNALKKAGAVGEIVFIGHNLANSTKKYLLEGSMDIVIHQNMRKVAEQALGALCAHLEKKTVAIDPVTIEIITRENIEGAVYG